MIHALMLPPLQFVKTICVAIALCFVVALFFGKGGTKVCPTYLIDLVGAVLTSLLKSPNHDDSDIPPAFGVRELGSGENPVVE